MNQRRVLHVNDYPPSSLGGAEVVMSRTVELLRTRGWDARTFSSDDLPDPRLTPWRYIDNYPARRALRAELHRFCPDVVHLHNFYHLLSPGSLAELRRYRRVSNARIVMTAHDYHLVCPNAGGTWFQNGEPTGADFEQVSKPGYLFTKSWDHRGRGHAFLKLAQHVWNYRFNRRSRVIDLVICPSRFLQSAVARLRVPTVWVPNASPAPPTISACRPDQLTLVFAGRLEPEKGIFRFVEMLPGDFAGRLVIVGDGVDRPRLERLIRDRNIAHQVELTGRLPHAEAIKQIASAHVLVLPSRWDENYPLSIAEALAMQTNVLVTDRGGMREIVLDAGVGYRFVQDNAESVRVQLHAIYVAHRGGQLNAFDVTKLMQQRNESNYIDAIERAYLS